MDVKSITAILYWELSLRETTKRELSCVIAEERNSKEFRAEVESITAPDSISIILITLSVVMISTLFPPKCLIFVSPLAKYGLKGKDSILTIENVPASIIVILFS